MKKYSELTEKEIDDMTAIELNKAIIADGYTWDKCECCERYTYVAEYIRGFSIIKHSMCDHCIKTVRYVGDIYENSNQADIC